MHIAVAYDCLFPFSKGGGERQYRQFAEALAAAGHEVTYLTRRQWDGDLPPERGVRFEAVSGGGALYTADGVRRTGPALAFARGLATHLLRHRRRYDAVLVSALPATNVPAVRAALAGSGVVVVADWLEVWPADQWREYAGPVVGRAASGVQRLAVRLSPIATCHSQLNADRLRAEGVRRPPLVSPGLIDAAETGRPVVDEVDPPHVVYVGRHIPDKRVEAIPAAVAHARRTVPGLTATLFGEGPSSGAVRAEIARLGLERVVAMPGFVTQESIDAALRRASALVHPSAREGYGLVVVEAAAHGTPTVLVAGPSNAAVELVEPGVNGVVASSASPADLGDAIVEVVRAGADMRRTTAAWHADAARTRTVRATVARILEAVSAEAAR